MVIPKLPPVLGQWAAGLFAERVAAEDWCGVLCLASSEQCLTLLRQIWSRVPPAARPQVLADAISTADVLVAERRFLLKALRNLRHLGPCVFDGDTARKQFAQLPDTITIYRGTVEAEGRRYGISWTLDRERAEWFATKHGRYRNTESRAVVLTCEIMKSAVSGLLAEREEAEIVIHPTALRGRQILRAGPT